MTKEDKELLLKDLCARLPYGVKCNINGEDIDVGFVGITAEIFPIKTGIGFSLNKDIIKPYLHSMSSMTEDEKHEFYDICTELSEDKNHFIMESCIDSNYMLEKFNWLNAHHFDYRGLIEKNLALDCTGLHIYD